LGAKNVGLGIGPGNTGLFSELSKNWEIRGGGVETVGFGTLKGCPG